MAAWRYEISLPVLKKYFSTLEEKFHISKRPFNILYFFLICLVFIIGVGGRENIPSMNLTVI